MSSDGSAVAIAEAGCPNRSRTGCYDPEAESYLMFERLSDEGLAQSSYLIACERTRQAAVVDPRRDIDVSPRAAARHGLTIAYAIETHTHADFVSGARELAALGARVVAGPGAALRFPFHEAAHRERLRIGDIVDRVPAHAGPHARAHFVARARARASRRALSPATRSSSARSAGRISWAPSRRASWPASSTTRCSTRCWRSTMTSKCTLGTERDRSAGRASARHHIRPSARNGASTRSSSCGVAARSSPPSLDDLPETPPYFPRMKQINQQRPGRARAAQPCPRRARSRRATWRRSSTTERCVIDMRSPGAFAAGHPAGALNIGFGPRIGYWAGWIVPPAGPSCCSPAAPIRPPRPNRQLLRVGLDDVVRPGRRRIRSVARGGGFTSRTSSSSPHARCATDCAAARAEDARRRAHRARVAIAGHIDAAINVPVGDLRRRVEDCARPDVVATDLRKRLSLQPGREPAAPRRRRRRQHERRHRRHIE